MKDNAQDPLKPTTPSPPEPIPEPEGLDPRYRNVDPLKPSYDEAVLDAPGQMRSHKQRRSALLCIDMQHLDAAPGHGVFADALSSGVPQEAQEYYFGTLRDTVLPNVRRLQDAFRSLRLEVIHIKIESLTRDGRDRSPGHRRLGLHAAPGSKEAEFLDEVAPAGDEIVIRKTASGVFNSTNLAYVLSNLGVDTLFITGVYTDECVSTAVRDACDLGYHVTLVADGCTTVTPDRHNFTIATLSDRYARILGTSEVLDEMQGVREEVRHLRAEAAGN